MHHRARACPPLESGGQTFSRLVVSRSFSVRHVRSRGEGQGWEGAERPDRVTDSHQLSDRISGVVRLIPVVWWEQGLLVWLVLLVSYDHLVLDNHRS